MNDWVTFRGGIGYARALTTNKPDGGDESTDTAGNDLRGWYERKVGEASIRRSHNETSY